MFLTNYCYKFDLNIESFSERYYMENLEKLTISKYIKGSYVTIKDRPSNGIFYIIKEGDVIIRNAHLLQSEITQHPGDFINVIPALTNHDCDESTLAITDAAVIVVSNKILKVLIQNNVSVALNMLKIFTQKLRLYNYCIETLSGATKPTADEDNSNLFFTAEYYYKDLKPSLAKYAFTKYIDMSPNGSYVKEAVEMLESIESVENASYSTNNNCIVYKDSQFVFCEGETGNELYFIKSGHIKITKVSNEKETIFAVLGGGDIFGEMAILDDKSRSANAVTIGETELVFVNKNAFKQLIETQLDIIMKLIYTLADRVWLTSKTAENLIMKDPIAKMYGALVTILKKDHIEFASKETYRFDFNLIDLAHMSGIDKENINETIEKIKKDKVIREISNSIHVGDLEKLKSIADYHKAFDTINRRKKKHKEKLESDFELGLDYDLSLTLDLDKK